MSAEVAELPNRTWGAKWAAAMVKAQGQFPTIAKSSDVEVAPKQGRAYSYSYAAFDLVIKKVQPVLEASGLAVIQDEWTEECQMVDDQGVLVPGVAVCVQTTVIHESGEYREYRPLVHRGFGLRIHDLGSLTSYLRRYAFLCALRLAPADEDDDGKNEMERPAAAQKRRDTHSPKPEGWDKQDTRKTTEYQTRILAAVNEGRDVLEMWDEVTQGGEAFTTAVWSQLPAPIKNLIKEEKSKRGTRAA